MKTKLIFILPFLALTACSTYKDPVHNPQSLNNDDLIKTQIARIEAMQREMDKRETELKFQHIKELNQVQTKSASQGMQTVNTNCRFLCF
jgi:hypothetical protein